MGRKVLLIIDVQRLFITEQTRYLVSKIKRRLALYSYDLVIQSRWVNSEDTLFFKALGYQDGFKWSDGDLAIHDDSHYVITRSSYSCITRELQNLLHDDDEIFVCGLETDACVLASCFSLWDLGYTFHVLRQCVYTSDKDRNAQVLSLMQRQFGSDVLV